MPVRDTVPSHAALARVDRTELVYSIRMVTRELEQLACMAESADLAAAARLQDAVAEAKRAIAALVGDGPQGPGRYHA